MKLCWLAITTLVLGACDGLPPDSEPISPEPASRGEAIKEMPVETNDSGFEVLATGKLDNGYQLKVLGSPLGKLVYLESGPVGIGSKFTDDDVEKDRTPAKVFARALPGVKIPETLMRLSEAMDSEMRLSRANESEMRLSEAKESENRLKGAFDRRDDVLDTMPKEPNVGGLTEGKSKPHYATELDSKGLTGSGGCPSEFFKSLIAPQWSYGGTGWCRPYYEGTGSVDMCGQYYYWAYLQSGPGASNGSKGGPKSGSGIVCVDSGIALLAVTEGSRTSTWAIPAGTWLRAYVSKTYRCGVSRYNWPTFFSCNFYEEKFIKFDLANTGAISSFMFNINRVSEYDLTSPGLLN